MRKEPKLQPEVPYNSRDMQLSIRRDVGVAPAFRLFTPP